MVSQAAVPKLRRPSKVWTGMNTIAHIGLGSNLDDRRGHLDRALDWLRNAEGCGRIKASHYHETPPVGGPPGQHPYLNAAAEVETDLSASDFLDLLQSIELKEGRVRRQRWGERTLDLDILLFGDRIITTDRLVVPHPRISLRMFVLAPLATIAPDAIEPRSGKRVQELLANCQARPGCIDLPGWKTFAPKAHSDLSISLASNDWLIHDSLDESNPGIPSPTFRVLWKQALKDHGAPSAFASDWPPKIDLNTPSEQAAISEVITAAEATRSTGRILM